MRKCWEGEDRKTSNVQYPSLFFFKRATEHVIPSRPRWTKPKHMSRAPCGRRGTSWLPGRGPPPVSQWELAEREWRIFYVDELPNQPPLRSPAPAPLASQIGRASCRE